MENKQRSSRTKAPVPTQILPSKRTRTIMTRDLESDDDSENATPPPPKSLKARKSQSARRLAPASDSFVAPKAKTTKSSPTVDPKKPYHSIFDNGITPFTRHWWRDVSKNDEFWVQFKKCIPATTLKKRLGLAIKTNVERGIGNSSETENAVKASERKGSSSAKVAVEVPSAKASATCGDLRRESKTCNDAASTDEKMGCDGNVGEEGEGARENTQVKDCNLKSVEEPKKTTSNGTRIENTSNVIAPATAIPISSTISAIVPPPTPSTGTADSPITLEDDTTTLTKQEGTAEERPLGPDIPSTSTMTHGGAHGQRGYIVKAKDGTCWIMADGVFRKVTSMMPLVMQG